MGYSMIEYVLLSLFISSLSKAHSFFMDFVPDNDTEEYINSQMGVLAEQVWEKSFSGRPCVVLWSEPEMLSDFHPKSQPSVIRITTDPAESCDTSLNNLGPAFEFKCNTYIVQISNPTCFFEMWDSARDFIVPRHNPTLFFLPVYPNSTDYGENLLALPITEITANILVAELEDSDEWQVKLSTNNFAVRVGTPNRTGRIPLDEWSPYFGFKNNVNLYPNKFKDLQGKEVRVSTVQYLPHFNLEPFEGTEANILIEYCKKFNCTLKVYGDDGNQWGSITGKKEGNGIVGKIYKAEADFGGAGFTTFTEFYCHIDYSANYMFSGVALLVPKAVLLSAWRTPFLPFGLTMWMLFFLCLAVSSLGLYAFTALSIKYTRFGNEIKKRKQFTTLTDSLIRSWGMSVLQQPTNLIPHYPVRHLFTSFEILYLILTACYSAELASYLTSPHYMLRVLVIVILLAIYSVGIIVGHGMDVRLRYTKPIDTYQEFANSGLTWIADNIVWSLGFVISDKPQDKIILEHFKMVSYPEILKLALTGKYGLAIERLVEGHYAEYPHITEEVIEKYHPMDENLQAGFLTMILEKGSAYAESMNDHILHLLHGGIFACWEDKMAMKLLNYRIQLALIFAKKKKKGIEEPKLLTVDHIQGAFFIYVVGIVISIGFLIFEILENKRKEKLRKQAESH